MDFWKSRKFITMIVTVGIEMAIATMGAKNPQLAELLMTIVGALGGATLIGQGAADAFGSDVYHKNRKK